MDMHKHHRELAGALRDDRFDVSEGGVVLMGAVRAQGVFDEYVNGVLVASHTNRVVDQGFVDILNTYFHTTNKKAGFYVALFAGAVTPAANWTAASFPATASEITSGSEGYTQSTRPVFTVAAAATPQIDNYASKAAFTIATASTLNVNGAAILSEPTKGSTSGVLVAAARYANTRQLQNGDSYEVGYRFVFSAV
jgi:hypothetical protein